MHSGVLILSTTLSLLSGEPESPPPPPVQTAKSVENERENKQANNDDSKSGESDDLSDTKGTEPSLSSSTNESPPSLPPSTEGNVEAPPASPDTIDEGGEKPSATQNPKVEAVESSSEDPTEETEEPSTTQETSPSESEGEDDLVPVLIEEDVDLSGAKVEDEDEVPSRYPKRKRSKVDWLNDVQKGFFVGTGVALQHCRQALCDDFGVAGMFRFELGHRYQWIALVVDGGAGRAGPKSDTLLYPLELDEVRFRDFSGGVQLFLGSVGRVEPMLAFSLGRSTLKMKYEEGNGVREDVDFTTYLWRPFVRIGAGTRFRLPKAWWLSIRADMHVAFKGYVCTEGSVDYEDIPKRCEEFSNEVTEAVWNVDEDERPLMWSIGLAIGKTFTGKQKD